MNLLHVLWMTPAAIYLLFLLYVECMAFKRAWPQMGLGAKCAAAPVVLAGVFWDWFVNQTFACVIFLGPSGGMKELVTGRLHRYRDDPKWAGNWRQRLAAWFCGGLNHFDPSGKHC